MYNPGTNYINHIKNNYTRTPKSKIVVKTSDNTEYTYTGEDFLVTYPKINHTTTQLIGGFPAKTCEFEIYNRPDNPVVSLNGCEITVYRGLLLPNTTTPVWVPMGIFAAEDADIKNNINKRSISFKGTDRTRLFERKYTTPTGITESSTMLAFVNAICTRCGVELEGSISMARNLLHAMPNVNETATDRQMIAAIAEMNGCIAIITRNGKLQFKEPATVSSDAAIPKNKYKTLSYENVYGPVNVVYFGHEDYEDTVHYPELIPENEVKWVIKDNPIIDSDREWWLNGSRVPANILGKEIRPFEITELIDDYIYDLGDIVTVTDKNGNDIEVTVLSVVTSSRIKSTFKADTPTGHEADKALSGSLKESIKSVKLEVDHVNNRVTSLVIDPDTGQSKIEQNASSIATAVGRIENIEGAGYVTTAQVDSKIEQKADTISLSVSKALNLTAHNLLLDSANCFENSAAEYVNATKRSERIEDTVTPSGKSRYFRFIPTSGDCGVRFTDVSALIGGLDKLQQNHTYTLSFYASSNTSTSFVEKYLIVYNGNELAQADIVSSVLPELGYEDKRYLITFKTNQVPAKLNISFRVENQNTTALWISSIQLEEGDTATPWLPNESEIKLATKAELALYVKTDEDGKLASFLDIEANKLSIKSDNFELTRTGEITAVAGTIGGWNIFDGGLFKERFKDEESQGCTVLSNQTEVDNLVVLAAGADNTGTADNPSFDYDTATVLLTSNNEDGNVQLRLGGSDDYHIVATSNYIGQYNGNDVIFSISTAPLFDSVSCRINSNSKFTIQKDNTSLSILAGGGSGEEMIMFSNANAGTGTGIFIGYDDFLGKGDGDRYTIGSADSLVIVTGENNALYINSGQFVLQRFASPADYTSNTWVPLKINLRNGIVGI